VFVALDIQHAMRIRRIILSYGLSGFTNLFHIHKRHDYGGREFIAHKTCVLILCTHFFSEAFLILGRIEQDMITNVYGFACKVPLSLSDCNYI
jgi:hypothetical protein